MSDKTPEEQLEALKAKNAELLNDMASLKELKKGLDALGGLDTIKSIVESSTEFKEKAAKASNDVEVVRSTLSAQVEAANKKAEAFKNKIVSTRVESQLKSVVQEQGGVWDLLEHKIKSRVKHSYNEDTDEVKIEVLDEKGAPHFINGKEAVLSDLVGEYKTSDVFKRAFEINNTRSGTGAPPSTTGAKTSPSNPFLNGTVDEQTKLWQTNNTLARRLQAEAKGAKASA